MNRSTFASMQGGILHYKNLTVGDMRPDTTTKLYKRMFKSASRKYIPVKDITNDTMGRELSAYLINPEYIDKSVIDPGVVTRQLHPAPLVRAVQYSRLSYQKPLASNKTRVINRTAALFSTAARIGRQAVSSVKELVKNTARQIVRTPFRQTYSIGRGMSFNVRRKVFARTGGFIVVATFGIFGLQTIQNQQSDVNPIPISAPPTSSQVANPITSSGITPSQTIPLFNTANVPNTTQPGNNTAISHSSQNEAKAANQYEATEQHSAVSSPTASPAETAFETQTSPTNSPAQAPTPAAEEESLETTVTGTVEAVVDTTTQTLNGVGELVDDLL